MPSKNPLQRLKDILDNIDAIKLFTDNLNFESFIADRKTVYAVTRALEIISEATRRLPLELKQRYPEIQWADVAAAGNIYRHEYEQVDDALLWHTIENSLDVPRCCVMAELEERRGQL